MAKFLDENGVEKLWSRIQEYVYECGCNGCDGSSGGTTAPLIANLSEDLRDASCENVAVTDKTFDEISEAYLSGRSVLFNDPLGTLFMVTMVNSQTKTVNVFAPNDEDVVTDYKFRTTEDGKMYYPHCEM